MNPDSVFLVERPYQDVVDDLLTAVVGGITNEPILFDDKEAAYRLARPALDVRSITGSHEGRRHTFQKSVDFLFSDGDRSVVWQDLGTRPDDETTFYVDYVVPDSASPITDLNVGSVTRTLVEAIGRETAIVYAQVNEAYKSAFIDTAEGRSLDLVVSILGIARRTKESAVGLATFFRDPVVDGNITIPEGVVLVAAPEPVRFETSEARTLQRGQARIDVPIRATEQFKGDAGKVAAGAIVEMAAPIAGISRVTNFDPTVLGAEDETDRQLRARAKAVLGSLGKATLAALMRVIVEGRGRPVEVWDAGGAGLHQAQPGSVTILVEAEPERIGSLRAAVHETRAAGVEATLIARYVFFKPRLAVAVRPGLTAIGKEKVVTELLAALGSYVDGLTSGDDAQGAKLLDAVKKHPDVRSFRLADVITWRSELEQPGAAGLAQSVLDGLAGVGGAADEAARRAAVEAALSGVIPAVAPSGRRVVDRSLLRGPDGTPATDAQIEAGQFVVGATVGGQPWWVVLDMEPADVAVREA